MSCAAFVPSVGVVCGGGRRGACVRTRRMTPVATAAAGYDRAAVRRLYEQRAATYDANADYHRALRDILVDAAPAARDARVLDLCSGTGIISLAAAAAVGPAGRVVGVDLTQEMVDVARTSADRDGLRNVEFRVGDVEREGDIADAARAADPAGGPVFDVVYCSAAQVWIDDLQGALAMWRQYVRPGGMVAFNAWSETSFVIGAILQKVAWDKGYTQVPNWHGRTATPERCKELLRGAGWDVVDVLVHDMSTKKFAPSVKEGFDELLAKTPSKSATSPTLQGLFDAAQLAELKEAYYRHVDELTDENGDIKDEITTYTVVGRNAALTQ